ncbi:HDOD domain-containing protein [Alteromonadaceae bacterium BrNp21-10]|nr:HDOD domain-containing protein [Alteromonadaceae bacterium BrNp21-10]
MNTTTDFNIVDDIEFRIQMMMTDLTAVKDMVAVAAEGQIKFKETEQNNARRQLLRVEKLAQRDKELHARSQKTVMERVAVELHDKIKLRLEENLVETDAIYRKILGGHENLPDALDILNVRASSMGRIEPAIATMPWLQADILKMVNMPKYRRTDSKGKSIAVESLRMALSFVGMDNLKMVVPAFAFRRWLPQITDPYPSIKGRLWDSALGSAISCRKIAQVTGQDEGQAFALGMFNSIGTIVVVRLYFRLFDEIQRESLKEAEDNYQQQEFDALRQVQPQDSQLRELLQQHAAKITASVIDFMDMRRVFIANAYSEHRDQVALKDRSPMGKILAQGVAYTNYRNLKGYNLINVDEAKAYLREFAMPKGSLAALKQTDLRKIDMTFDDDES